MYRRQVLAGVGASLPLNGIARGTPEDADPVPIRPLRPAEVHWSTIPQAATGVRPGSLLQTSHPEEGTLYSTANFIWREAGENPDRWFIGTAGHAVLPEPNKVTPRICVECTAGVGDLRDLGEVVFASYCPRLGTDFGLVEIPTTLHSRIDRSVPTFGGPTAVGSMRSTDAICHYGQGAGIGQTYPTRGRVGMAADQPDNGGWRGQTSGLPGDSGSPVQVCEVRTEGAHGTKAAGILTKLLVGDTATTGGITVERATELVNNGSSELDPSCGQGGVIKEASNLTIEPVLPGGVD